MSHSPLRKTAVQLEKLPRHFQCHRRMCEACQEHSYCGCGGWSVIQSWTEPQCSIAQLVVEAEHQRKVADDIGDTQFILAASQTPWTLYGEWLNPECVLNLTPRQYLTLWQSHAISILLPWHIILFVGSGDTPGSFLPCYPVAYKTVWSYFRVLCPNFKIPYCDYYKEVSWCLRIQTVPTNTIFPSSWFWNLYYP
jgi:hypothetical protein